MINPKKMNENILLFLNHEKFNLLFIYSTFFLTPFFIRFTPKIMRIIAIKIVKNDSDAPELKMVPINEPIIPAIQRIITGLKSTLHFFRKINPATPPIIQSIIRLVPIA